MEFKKTQENGDATSNYKIITDKKTVLEFIYELRKYIKLNQEWGSIYVSSQKSSIRNKIGNYSNSSITFTKQILDYGHEPIFHVWANGGWGLMDYYIVIEE